MPSSARPKGETPSQEVARRISEMGDWRGQVLARARRLIHEADPEMTEEMKWKKPSNPAGVPVWSDHGIVCTGEAHTAHLRFTFARGASLADPDKVFNSGFNGRTLRAIVVHEGETLNEAGFKGLIRAAVAANRADAPASRKK